MHGSKSKVFSEPLRRASTFSLKREKTTKSHDTNIGNIPRNTSYCCDRPSGDPTKLKNSLKHPHNPVDEFFVLLGNVCRAFGGGWGDEGRRPDTVGVLIPPLFRLLPQLGFLFLVQVRDSSSGETNTTAYIYCAFVKDEGLVRSPTAASVSAGLAAKS